MVIAAVILVSVFQSGCDDGTKVKNGDGKNPADKQGADAKELTSSEGLLDSAGNLMNKARESGANGLNWIQDQVGNAAGSGAEMAGDSATWVSDTFNSL